MPKTEPAHPCDPCEHADDPKSATTRPSPPVRMSSGVTLIITPPAGTATRSDAQVRAGVRSSADVSTAARACGRPSPPHRPTCGRSRPPLPQPGRRSFPLNCPPRARQAIHPLYVEAGAARRQARQARVQASSPASSISLTSASSPTTHHAGRHGDCLGKPSRQFTEVEPGGRPRLAKSLLPAMRSAHAPKAPASHPHRNAWTRYHHNARQPRSCRFAP